MATLRFTTGSIRIAQYSVFELGRLCNVGLVGHRGRHSRGILGGTLAVRPFLIRFVAEHRMLVDNNDSPLAKLCKQRGIENASIKHTRYTTSYLRDEERNCQWAGVITAPAAVLNGLTTPLRKIGCHTTFLVVSLTCRVAGLTRMQAWWTSHAFASQIPERQRRASLNYCHGSDAAALCFITETHGAVWVIINPNAQTGRKFLPTIQSEPVVRGRFNSADHA
ncbi:hypothetical protein JB92DRAFT_2832643 [Gautieria morchelliformis]|nr:hypothetical protein JB92DRAFT_2832643 [Gautieria morchelliformis]